jgi:exosortase A-associated hydrolase 1
MSDAVLEHAFTFSCENAALVGILHQTRMPAKRGILMVVGGPQYRVGSHRQFVLLARSLAANGIPVMRFDHRGIGDSDDPYLGFEALDRDLAAAIGAFHIEHPTLKEIVLWGLCDAASAILLYAYRDPRVAGIVLLNPWVRTAESEARTYLRHYYVQRLLALDFWQNLLSGRIRLRQSALSLWDLVARLSSPATRPSLTEAHPVAGHTRGPFPDRMAQGFSRFKGPILLVMSGQDLTAREFDDVVRLSSAWRGLLQTPRLTRRDLAESDHTFSRQVWRDKVARWTLEWIERV